MPPFVRTTSRDYATANFPNSSILIAGMTSIFLFCVFLVSGKSGIIIALLITIAMNGFAYWDADKVILRIHAAKRVDRGSTPSYFGIVEQLAINTELPVPQVYIVENEQRNAFATGRNPEVAAIAAKTVLRARLGSEKIAGVMPHELAHLKNARR